MRNMSSHNRSDYIGLTIGIGAAVVGTVLDIILVPDTIFRWLIFAAFLVIGIGVGTIFFFEEW